MTGSTHARRHRRRTATLTGLALVLAVGTLGGGLGTAAPAAADPPPTSAGNVFHGFRLDGDDFQVIDHPDAGTVPTPALGVTGTQVVGTNDRGDIVGAYADRSDEIRNFVRTRRGAFTEIDPPGSAANEELHDINNRGEIVGFVDETGDNAAGTRGFLRMRDGRYRFIDVPGAASTTALGVNDRGQVAGVYFDPATPGSAPGLTPAHGFVWDDGEVTTFDHPDAPAATFAFDINDRGDTAGFFVTADGRSHGFVRDRLGRFTTVEVPGAAQGTQLTGINDRGDVVGNVVNADLSNDAFHRSRRGQVTMIAAPGEASYTRALDVDNRGAVVGDYDTEPRPGTTVTTGVTPTPTTATATAGSARARPPRMPSPTAPLSPAPG